MTRLPALSLSLALLVLFVLPAAAQQELLTNPDFEAIGEDGIPTGWSRYGGNVPESRIEVADDAHSGERAIRLIDTGPEERDNTWAVGLTQDVAVEPNRLYLLSVHAKAISRNHDAALNLQLRFLPSNTLRNITMAPAVGGDWQRYAVALEAPEDTTTARIYIFTTHYWTTESLIDDASLQVVDRETWGTRFPLAAHGSMGVDEARPLNLRTPIVTGGQPAATICIPEGEQYAALGERLAAAIEAATGARLPVTADARSLVGKDGTIIALGNLNNNFVIERLYWNKYLEINALKPGAGAHLLQVVHEPFNWPRGMNIVVVGASDDAGLAAGVEALIARVPQAAEFAFEGPLLEVSNAPVPDEAAEQRILDQPVGIDVTRQFWEAVRSYRDTGQLVRAQRAKAIILGPAAERFQQDPAFHITWPEETTSDMIGAMWDVVEEAPVWTDAERLQATNVILNTLYVLPARTSGYSRIEENPGIIWNHTTFPLIGIYWMSRWFERYYGDVDGQMSVMQRKCRHAFMNQARSWKPQEDAAGYVSIVPEHTMEYTLAENDYVYFENGSVLRHAEYEVGFCDNTGDAAGFGDSGYAQAPYARNLHWALWYYRDGRFLWWLDRVREGDYASPYDQSVQPVVWEDLAGATVYELHPEVYQYTTNFADYGGEPTPPNIPLEKCFDKIAFRENLEMDAEYFLLDGYSRGKHLQYDGNAIIKYYADGRDWLVDGDYLVRNTTDHNGVSVIRDGRAAELIPSCTALEAIADMPTATLCETAVYDYNGADWIRNIVWLKGEFVLVTDRLRANEAGDYSFVGNWKTFAEGEQSLEEGRIFSTLRQGPGGVGSRELSVATEPAEGVAKAIKFGTSSSRLDTALDLPAGKYELTLFASGTGSGSDSFYVSVDGGEETDFHIPVGVFGPSSATWEKDAPTPNIEIAQDGLHRLTITLREGPGPVLDRFVVRNEAGEVMAEVEAEDAPPVPAEWVANAPVERFFIKADGVADSSLTGRIDHVGRHITYMRQRLGGEMQPGEVRTFHTIFYNDTDGAPKDWDVRRISDEAALVTRGGQPHMIVLMGDEALMNGDAEMRMGAFTRTGACGAEVTQMRDQLYMEQPISVELQTEPPFMTIVGPPDLQTVSVGGMPLMLQEGRLEMDLSGFGELAAGLAELDAIFNRYLPRVQTPSAAGGDDRQALPSLEAERVVEVEVSADHAAQPVRLVHPVDLTGDGAEEMIVLRGPVAQATSASGETLWRFEAGGKMLSVAHADLDGDGAPEVLVGSADEHLYVLDARSGELQRKHHVDVPLRVGTSSIRLPQVGAVAVGDVDADGALDIIVGTMNGNLLRYDLDFNEIWRYNRVPHGPNEMTLHDLDGDGTLNIVLANHYGAVEVFDESGRRQPGVYSELGDVQMAIGDLNGDGVPEIANGSSTGAFTLRTWRTQEGFSFPNYGFAFSEVLMGQLLGDANPDLLVASETGYVYSLGPGGEVLAQCNLQQAVNDIALIPGDQPRVAAACDDGRVYLLDAALQPIASLEVGDRPLLVEVVTLADGPRLIIGTREAVQVVGP